jgi:hypothetical protein
MAITLRDPAVLVVDAQLSLLAAADLPPEVDRLLFGIEMPRSTVGAPALDVPAVALVRDYMMGLGSAFAYHILVSFWIKVI